MRTGMSLRNKYLLSILCFLFVLKIFILKDQPITYITHEDMQWRALPSCELTSQSPIDHLSESAIVRGEGAPLCISEKFPLHSSTIAIEYAYEERTEGKSNPYVLELIDEKNKVFYKKLLPNTSQSRIGVWNRLYLHVGNTNIPSIAKLRIRAEKSHVPKLHVRDRIDFLDRAVTPQHTSEIKIHARLVFDVIVSLIIFMTSVLIFPALSQKSFLFLLVAISVAVHFEYQPFFYFDEWHVLQRFSSVPFPQSIILTHNEHFLPLYFFIFFLQAKIFGAAYSYYLLCNCIMMGVYGYAVYLFLKEISIQEKPARLLSLLFCISSLHVEALQWAFEGSIILCSILGLHFLRFSARYCKYRYPSDLVWANICICISPFIFGGAFPYVPVGIMLCLLYGLYFTDLRYLTYLFSRKMYVVTVAAVILFPLSLYSFFKLESSGHAVDESTFLSNIPALIEYVALGTGIGSILRPLGLYPFLSITHPQQLINSTTGSDMSVLNSFYFALITCLSAILLLCALMYVFISEGQRKRATVIFSIGLSLIVFYILVVGFGRWRYGAHQSLALRYQVQTLPGLIIMISPLIERLFNWNQANRNVRYIFVFFACLWVLVQSVSSQTFMYFRYNGDLDRVYVQAGIEAYDENLVLSLPKASILPTQSDTITPGRSLLDIVKTYYWLSK